MKNVLITAGSRGIGFAIAKELAMENFNLILKNFIIYVPE
tara:strand:+ start:3429 stop:3548 length:120 start_codon:yes stop_codon:yes gene_type:complete